MHEVAANARRGDQQGPALFIAQFGGNEDDGRAHCWRLLLTRAARAAAHRRQRGGGVGVRGQIKDLSGLCGVHSLARSGSTRRRGGFGRSRRRGRR
eukprot:402080-Rhodomonas_salina.1